MGERRLWLAALVAGGLLGFLFSLSLAPGEAEAQTGGGCNVSRSCSASSFSTTGPSTAEKFISTVQGDGGQGNKSFSAQSWSIWDLGGGTNDFCYSNNSRVVCNTMQIRDPAEISSNTGPGTGALSTILVENIVNGATAPNFLANLGPRSMFLQNSHPNDGGYFPSFQLSRSNLSQNVNQILLSASSPTGSTSNQTDRFRVWESGGAVQMQGTHDAGIPTCAAGSPDFTNGSLVSEGTLLFVKNDKDAWFCDGTRWAEMQRGLSASATLDFSSIPAGDYADHATTITVTGAASGDVCNVGAGSAAWVGGAAFHCFVSAADTVTVRGLCSDGANACDPGSATFLVRVIK